MDSNELDPRRMAHRAPRPLNTAQKVAIGAGLGAAGLAALGLGYYQGGPHETPTPPVTPVTRPVETATLEQTLSPEAILEQQANEVYDGTIELDNPTLTVINPGSEDNQRSVGLNDIQELGGQSIVQGGHITIEVTDPLIHADGSRIQIILPAMVDAQGRTVAIDWNPYGSDSIKVTHKGSGFEKIEKTEVDQSGIITVIKNDGTTETADQVAVQMIDDQPAVATAP